MGLGEFFMCLLRGDCEYSIKKFLTFIFTITAVYLMLFTEKDAMLVQNFLMIGALLALRSYDKTKYNKN